METMECTFGNLLIEMGVGRIENQGQNWTLHIARFKSIKDSRTDTLRYKTGVHLLDLQMI